MSHFPVLIIGKNPEKQLAPYSEQDKKYKTFVDKTEEARKEYRTLKLKEFYDASCSSWGAEITKELFDKLSRTKIGVEFEYQVVRQGFSYFKKNDAYKGYYAIPGVKGRMKSSRWFKVTNVIETNHPDKDVCFEGRIKIQRIAHPKKFLASSVYKTFEEFATEYHEYQEKNGKYGYYSNVNAKWDWHELGGRFTGMLKLKDGAKGVIGDPGIMTDAAGVGTADQALKKDIDFAAMYAKNIEEATKAYDSFEELYLKDKDAAAKKAYWDFGVDNVSKIDGEFIPESRQQYIERSNSIATFAVVKDGKWYEKGEMGWWGISSNEKDHRDWDNEFKKLIDEIPEDTLLSIYDCHI